MKHFGISQWVDFARGVVAEAEGQAMQAHLADGCSDCGDLADFSASLTNLCESMSLYAAPAQVVRNAKAIFPAAAPAQPKRALRIAAQLVYDSFLVPAPAGLRATWQVGWQALYRAGDCSLDVRIEPELASTRAAVIGQINNHTTPREKMANVPICLKSGRTIIAETRSNGFGEFQIEYDQQPRLQLCVYLEDGSKCFQVPLKKFAAERNAGTERLGLGSGQSKSKQEQE
jgi:hypothetical protein